MRKRTVLGILVAAAGIAVLGGGAWAWAALAPTPINAARAEGVPVESGLRALVVDSPSAMSAGRAIELAKGAERQFASQTTSITAQHVSFSDTNMIGPIPGTNVAPKDVDAWIVTFHAVSAPFHGGYVEGETGTASRVVKGLNASSIIDATTGQELECVIYRPRN